MALTFGIEAGAGGASRVPARASPARRDLAGLAPVLGALGSLEVRLATTKKEIRQAQKLRYRVFFEEGGAIPDPTARLIRRDVCRFDRVCDHLIVVDKTLRLSRRLAESRRRLSAAAAGRGGAEFRLLQRRRIRRRAAASRASRRAIPRARPRLRRAEPSRQARARTAVARHVGLCPPSPHRRDDRLRQPRGRRSRRRTRARSARSRRAAAIPHGGSRRCPNAPALAARASRPLDAARADPLLPPLVKGYWRLGATFSPVPVVDRAFNTTDLFVVMPLHDIEERYLDYFGVEPVPAPLAA